MKNTKRIVSLTLSVLLAFSAVVIPSRAADSIQYSDADLHELVSYKSAVSAGHVNRLSGEEELNTLVFANSDNTKTMYYYAEAIKYEDENGEIHDKTNNLKYRGGAYVNPDNDVHLTLPANVSDGVSVSYDGAEIHMTPAFAAEVLSSKKDLAAVYSAAPKGEADAVTYKSVFGAGTSVKYTPMYSGVKEDIILTSYTGAYTFDFVIRTNGLILTSVGTGSGNVMGEVNIKDANRLYFAYPDEPETVIAELSDIVIYDSVGNTAQGYVRCKQIGDFEYTLTVVADKAFLESPDTVYPVTVDPTLKMVRSSTTYIMDATISSRFGDTKYGTETTLKLDSATDSSIVIMFPHLVELFSKLSSSQIIKTELVLSSQTGVESKSVNVYNYYPKKLSTSVANAWWENSLITYNNAGASVSSNYVTVSGLGLGPYSPVDITALSRTWTGSSIEQIYKGMLLKFASGVSGSYSYCSSEHATASLRPYLTVKYSVDKLYRIKNVASGKYMTVFVDCDETNGLNVYQSSLRTEKKYQSSQIFRVSYDASANAERICPLSSYNGRYRVLDVKYTNVASAPVDGCNIQIYKPQSGVAQFFDVINTSGTNYYTITLHSNSSLAITSVGTSNGENSKTGKTSAGNIYLGAYTGADNQKWILEEYDNAYESYYASKKIQYPFKGGYVPTKLSSDYGVRANKDTGEPSFHGGIDIPAVEGTAIYCAFSGSVVAKGFDGDKQKGQGHYIVVESDKYDVYGTETKLRIVYMHMRDASKLNINDTVTTDTIIGYVGNTGASTGPHLHISIIINGKTSSGNADVTINPLIFFPRTDFSFS